MWRIGLVFLVVAALLVSACSDDDYDFEDQIVDSTTKIHTQRNYFKDEHGRYLFIHGLNVSGSSKVPASVEPLTYVGKPFPLEDADWHFSMIKKLGFNTIRLVMMWEAIEPHEPGSYDTEFLDYIEQIVAKADKHGIYVLMDMHQDFFSRHHCKLFNDGTDGNYLEDPKDVERAAPFGLNNIVRGDGAPQWAVQLTLPEKDVGGPEWGLPRNLVSDPSKTSDIYPFNLWGLNIFISVDVNRSFATFFAGRDIYPNYLVDGENVQDYLQHHFAESWRQVAQRVSKYPNVIGYDVINEPAGLYIVFTLYALLYNEAKSGTLTDDGAIAVLDSYLAEMRALGMPSESTDALREAFLIYVELPKSDADFADAGFMPLADSPYTPDVGAALGLNSAFNRNYLQPLHELVGQTILEEDPDAVIWIEESLGLSDTGIGGTYAQPMLAPDGLEQIVYAPHYYTDIYPMIGFNQPPRDFTPEEKRFRDYMADGIMSIPGAIEPAKFSLGDPPVVMGEFGTYFNFGGIEKSIAQDYLVSSYILDIYYETYEEMLLHSMLWCYSGENTKENGENWNREDFSILDFDQNPRSVGAYSRIYPRFTSGRLLSFHYNSPFAYYDPRPGEVTPYLQFEMEMQSKETSAPTEVFVPPLIFTDGFYVTISDGRCAYDPETGIVYWWPEFDDPETIHSMKIRPPYDDYGDADWNYFFDGDEVLEGHQ